MPGNELARWGYHADLFPLWFASAEVLRRSPMTEVGLAASKARCVRWWLSQISALLALVLLLPLPSTLHASSAVDWTGVWDTRWRDAGAIVILQQADDRVVGTYPALDGIVQGRVDGSVLSGTWRDGSGSGTFIFAIAPDRQSFMGRFGSGEWWTGSRAAGYLLQLMVDAPDGSSPERTLYTVLRAGNEAGEGRTDRLGAALGLLDFGAMDEPLSAHERLRGARLLFQILDRLTFRVWSLRPPSLEGLTEHSAELFQAGTGLGYTVNFRRGEGPEGPDTWFLVVPPEEEMREALDALLEIHDGEVPHSRQHHELRSPRDTLRTFIEQWDSALAGDNALFLKTMDLSQIPATVGEDEGLLRGEYLKEVLYRIGLPLRQEIPDNRDRRGPFTHFMHPAGSVEVHLIEQDDGSKIWQFSAETMASARGLFMALEDMPLAEDTARSESTMFFRIREYLRSYHRELLREAGGGMELWQWFALVLWLVISIPVSWFLTWVVAKLFRLKKTIGDQLLHPAIRYLWPLRLIFVAGIGLMALRVLGLPQTVDMPLRIVIGVTLSIAGGWLAYHLVDRISRTLEAHSQRYRYRDEVLRSLLTSLAKLAVIIGAILFLAEILSLPYQGVLAGLGIGGLAVALAARSTLENFIGGITLFADKPVEVGDFCRLGEHLGVIESIGLRSVKVRSIDRTVVTIANAEFVNLNIENFTRRDRILLRTTIGLRYETTPDQLRWVLAEIRKLLLQHPRVTAEPARARFEGFGDHSVDIEIFAYVNTSDFNEFLAIQEDIFLRLIDIVDAAGTGFAFPSTVNYLARDTGVDRERTERTEAVMRELREGSELPFPDFDLKTRRELRNTLDYPPEGSVDARQRTSPNV